MTIKAVIFDFNGVIINDEGLRRDTWFEFVKRYNLSLTEEEYREHIVGHTAKENYRYLFKREVSDDEVNTFQSQRQDIFVDKDTTDGILTLGLREFLQYLIANNIKRGIGTSGFREHVENILVHFGLLQIFTTITTVEDVTHGKPNPDVYIKTAEKLAVDPSLCVVFEDSIAGITAGKAAGMKVIGLSTTLPEEKLQLADAVIPNFEGLTLEKINDLISM